MVVERAAAAAVDRAGVAQHMSGFGLFFVDLAVVLLRLLLGSESSCTAVAAAAAGYIATAAAAG